MGRFGDDGHLISEGSSYALAGEPGWVGGPYNASFVDANRTAALHPNPDFFTSVLWNRKSRDRQGRQYIGLQALAWAPLLLALHCANP
jgi:hypothetical protein